MTAALQAAVPAAGACTFAQTSRPVQQGAPSYTPLWTLFDGINDYLHLNAALSGVVDGSKGTLSFFMKFPSGAPDGGTLVGDTSSSRVTLLRTSPSDYLKLRLLNTALGLILDKQTNYALDFAFGQFHFLAAWDMTNPTPSAVIKINGSEAWQFINTGPLAGTVDYTRLDHGIMATATGTDKVNAQITEYYLNTVAAITDATKFASGKKPKNIGADGSGPSGAQPAIYIPDLLTGVNLGFSQDFSVIGSPVRV